MEGVASARNAGKAVAIAALVAIPLVVGVAWARKPTGQPGGRVSVGVESLPLNVTATMTGTATGGTTPIEMAMSFEIYSDALATWVPMSTSPPFVSNVPIGVPQTFTSGPFGPGGLDAATGRRTGIFRGRASMILRNILGSFGFLSSEVQFTIIEQFPPTGTVSITVA